ncbi:DNA polymerase III subunit alpha [Propionibacteriaceae bacterium Y1685]
MADPFVHLRVASGYSLQYGASHPADLVARAADHDMDILGLTDRDGLYGAVRFAKACLRAGIAPVLGVDLATEPVLPTRGRRRTARTPVRGGETRDHRLPRTVVLATSKPGWGSLCRLVSRTHLGGVRGTPISSGDLIAEHAASGELVVMLGADSEFGQAVAAERFDLAMAVLDRWRSLVPSPNLIIAVSHQRVGGRGAGSATCAGRMLRIADEQRIPAVLTHNVRMADRQLAPTLDVLDCARRLVALDRRHIDRSNAEGYLTSGKEMLELAGEVSHLAGREDAGEKLIMATRTLAVRCQLDPRADLGLGEVHLPELSVLNTDGIRTTSDDDAQRVLVQRCEAGMTWRYGTPDAATTARLADELAVIEQMGFASYFLTVADVVDLVRGMGVRCAARGSGAGSLVNHVLGISGVDPMRHGLVMERFLSPLRIALPDIDLDVESARRLEVYEKILATFGGERVACVAMLDTYRVRHAVRDVGAALSLPPSEIDAIAKAFPHIRARDARAALRDLPELRNAGLAERRLDLLFELVESLDGLPRHVALHPCGVLLSDTSLLDRTPVEASHGGYPMSQYDKDDVEDLGLLKLDVLGIRMQSSMAHALVEIRRTTEEEIDLEALPFDDADTFSMIKNAATLGCFQIESPGQRELIGKFAPETFGDIITDISLFRPGPVKSDMVTPFLEVKQGWASAHYLHPDLAEHLAETGGVVVFHEQVIKIIATMTGCTLAEADEARRGLGDFEGKEQVQDWFAPAARRRGYAESVISKVWEVLEAFASFGFCKAHAAAFALPTYQSAWLKAHHPAQFLAGVLTHDPGMYPKRLILEEVRRLGIAVLGLDVNASGDGYHVERLEESDHVEDDHGLGREIPLFDRDALLDRDAELDAGEVVRDRNTLGPPRLAPGAGLPDGRGWGIRISLAEVKGITDTEVARIVAGQPYVSLPDFWVRAQVSRPLAEKLVLAGAFDSVYGIGAARTVRRRWQVTRRDLLLTVADLDRDSRADARARSRARGLRRSPGHRATIDARAQDAAVRPAGAWRTDPRDLARAQSAAPAAPRPQEVQLALDFTDPDDIAEEAMVVGRDDTDAATDEGATAEDATGADASVTRLDVDEEDRRRREHILIASGLPEMTDTERVRAELEILGLDASRHVVDFYIPMLTDLQVVFAADLLSARSRSEVLIAGVKVATQTPPIRSGRRVVFLTLDDSTGPADATFFEDAQGPYAATIFSSWLLLVRGEVRRTGPRGISVRATGCWDLQTLHAVWRGTLDATGDRRAAVESVRAVLAEVPEGFGMVGERVTGESADGRDTDAAGNERTRAGGMGRRRVLVHASGFRQSPYADIKPAGDPISSFGSGAGSFGSGGTPLGGPAQEAPRKLWHSSPGSSGR